MVRRRLRHGEDIEQELGLAEVWCGAAVARGEREDGHARPAERGREQRAPEHGEVVPLLSLGLHRIAGIEVRVLARDAPPPLLVLDRALALRGAELDPLALGRAEVLVAAEEMRVLPLLVLVPPDAARAISPDIADADKLAVDHRRAGRPCLRLCKLSDMVIHLSAVDELRKRELSCERWWAVLGVLRLLVLAH